MCKHMRDSGYEAALVRHCLATYGAPCKPQQQQQEQRQQQQQEGGMEVDCEGEVQDIWALDERKVRLATATEVQAVWVSSCLYVVNTL